MPGIVLSTFYALFYLVLPTLFEVAFMPILQVKKLRPSEGNVQDHIARNWQREPRIGLRSWLSLTLNPCTILSAQCFYLFASISSYEMKVGILAFHFFQNN